MLLIHLVSCVSTPALLSERDLRDATWEGEFRWSAADEVPGAVFLSLEGEGRWWTGESVYVGEEGEITYFVDAELGEDGTLLVTEVGVAEDHLLPEVESCLGTDRLRLDADGWLLVGTYASPDCDAGGETWYAPAAE